MDYGKEITTRSYYNGKLKNKKTEYSIPVLIQDRSQALSEIMKGLEMITSKQTHKLILTIEADPKTYYLKIITKNYVVENDI